MDAITTSAALIGDPSCSVPWPDHDAFRMARDFLVWRHLRVLRARTMRHVHRFAARLQPKQAPRAVATAYGVPMIPNWSDRTYAYCHYGTYGHYLADLLLAVDRPFLFLDIGANQGLFSLIAARNPFCEMIIALEPVPDTHDRLVRNFAANGLDGQAQALRFGLSDHAAIQRIAVSRRHSGVATLEGHLARRNPHALQVDVEMRTAADLAPFLPAGLPIFAKVDVEGHEAQVIAQLLASPFAGSILALFYEHDRRWSNEPRIEAALAGADFGIKRRYGPARHHDVLALPLDTRTGPAA